MIEIDWNEKTNTAILICPSVIKLQQLREKFSCKNKHADIIRRRGGFCADRTYFITPKGQFNVGLLRRVVSYCVSVLGESITFSDKFKQYNRNTLSEYNVKELNIPPRDYQYEAVEKGLKNGRGIIELGTAGGKTLICAMLSESIIKDPVDKILIIVPDLGLVEQTYNDFEEYGVSYKFSKWTGNHDLDLSSSIIIANLGILQSKNSNLDWVFDCKAVLFDECHSVRKKNKLNNILKKIKTPHIFGFTGTLPTQQDDIYNIVGRIGEVIYKVPSYKLREQGYISNVQAVILRLKYKSSPPSTSSKKPAAKYHNELDFIIENKWRNTIISNVVNKLSNNTLILVDRIKHGEILLEQIKRDNKEKRVFFIHGDVELDDREKIKQLMESDNNIVCIAISKIFSTGISINNLHYILFANAGKAKIRVVQSIGRSLRLHTSKNKATIFDIGDQLKYGAEHLLQRLEIYKTEKIPYETKEIEEN